MDQIDQFQEEMCYVSFRGKSLSRKGGSGSLEKGRQLVFVYPVRAKPSDLGGPE